MLKIYCLSRYGNLGSSSRLRMIQYFKYAADYNFCIDNNEFFNDDQLCRRYKKGRYGLLSLLSSYLKRIYYLFRLNKYDYIWIEKELLPWVPAIFELFFLRNVTYILDYDDAVFHNYDRSKSFLVRFFLGNKLRRLMAKSALVVCGNKYLENYALESGSHKVIIIPTVVDLKRYPSRGRVSNLIPRAKRIVWIGSPSTVSYLNLIEGPLKSLAREFDFVLRVIGAAISIDGVKVECFEWSEESEASLISECDVGVMPLANSFWENGKCGYKIIQYMACQIPVVASPVGANCEIIDNGINGLWADSEADWIAAFKRVFLNTADVNHMAECGRLTVQRKFSVQVASRRLFSEFQEVGQHGRF